ncbi:MAG: CocE/NonD family hydrolase [Gemmatimonadaceae bacterium]
MRRLIIRVCLALLPLRVAAQAAEGVPVTHAFTIDTARLIMHDGVALSATIFRPQARTSGERFPYVLELLPYRKDDSFYLRDYPLYAYFAQRGIAMVKVDVRGTGSSAGTLPDREYSEIELQDAEEIIAQLARLPDSNGRVGMWGISWGGFNALQVAMRHPPALKAILALHAADDLYYDDVHYIDGVLHLDPYALQIDHENGLPRSPAYPLDSAYFADRFDREPWLFTYLRHSADGPWWRDGSLRFQYDRLSIPAYFIGGLLDGYRDTPLRALELSKGPVKAEIGPWAHDWPDNGEPGPGYEWRGRAVRWWRHWLLDDDTGLMREPRLIVYMRHGDAPNAGLLKASGTWRGVAWPLATLPVIWYLGGRNDLTERSGPPQSLRIPFRADAGVAAGDWWGDPTGDQQHDDAWARVFDSPPLSEPRSLLGVPSAVIRLRSGNAIGHWSVRLEDVAPDGSVALVTGALRNGAYRDDRLAPQPMAPGAWFKLEIPLHFTTWTFQAGHRIRLAIATSQFPMAWPSPQSREAWVEAGEQSRLALPLVALDAGQAVNLPPSEPRVARPDARPLSQERSVAPKYTDDHGEGTVILQARGGYTLGATEVRSTEQERYRVNRQQPGKAGFLAQATHDIQLGSRHITLSTTLDVQSTADSLRVHVTRRLTQNGQAIRTRTWSMALPRTIH